MSRPPQPIRYLILLAATCALVLAVCTQQKGSEVPQNETPPKMQSADPAPIAEPQAEPQQHPNQQNALPVQANNPAPASNPAPADAGAAKATQKNAPVQKQEKFFPASKSAGPLFER